jgi:hypothetical protein
LPLPTKEIADVGHVADAVRPKIAALYSDGSTKEKLSTFVEGFSGLTNKIEQLGSAFSIISTLFKTNTTGGQGMAAAFSGIAGAV